MTNAGSSDDGGSTSPDTGTPTVVLQSQIDKRHQVLKLIQTVKESNFDGTEISQSMNVDT